VARARRQVRAQRAGVAQELAAVRAHARLTVAVHARHVLRQLRVRAPAHGALLRHAAFLAPARPHCRITAVTLGLFMTASFHRL